MGVRGTSSADDWSPAHDAAAGALVEPAAEPAGLNWLAAVAPAVAELQAAPLAGMQNEAGEYHCFLNVVVQCLYHLVPFRTRMLAWPPHVRDIHPVLHALADLLAALAAAERAQPLHPADAASSSRLVVDPLPLREALATLPGQHEFGIGEC